MGIKIGKIIKKVAEAGAKAHDALKGLLGEGDRGSGPINPEQSLPKKRPTPEEEAKEKAATERAAKPGNELLRGFVNGVPGAVSAVGHFIENSAHSVGRTLSNSERRLREGKIIDAWWHLNSDPLSESEKNALKAAQESELVRSAMQAVATYYGGPAGAAAFAAWYTYRTTNNVELALKAGIIEGAKAYAIAGVGSAMPSGTAEEIAAKAVISGAIGGIAIAAAGGDTEDVGKGFLVSGASVAVLDGYELETGRTLGQDAKDAFVSGSKSVGGFIMDSPSSTHHKQLRNTKRETSIRHRQVASGSTTGIGASIGT